MEWYDPTTRNLPWKQTGDAYKIWLSEIIMQQTRVEQGTPYYLSFVKQYPTVKKLAAAPLDEVLKLWEGLGYYSRARNLHYAAKQVMTEHKGKFPSTHKEILKLKGIGSYTAAAISSFAYNLPHAVLDGNVFRFLSRVYGIETPVDSTAGKKQFENLATQLLNKKDPALYNQAIMDFGSLVCKPKNPLCTACPFSSHCKALELNKVQLLPVKGKKLIKTERHFHYLVLFDAKHIYIKQREANDIWKGLFEFPMVEEVDSPRATVHSNIFKNMDGVPNRGLWTVDHRLSYRQTLTHQLINGHFYELKTKKLLAANTGYLKISKDSISNYAFPKIVRTYLQDRLNFLS
ncbi:MAG: A/G-specific adenine glycosylase [Bacteroidota bacterium]|nr:A/G-specific adenine glycosylase [Bacteroidota bacterium]